MEAQISNGRTSEGCALPQVRIEPLHQRKGEDQTLNTMNTRTQQKEEKRDNQFMEELKVLTKKYDRKIYYEMTPKRTSITIEKSRKDPEYA